MNEFSPVNNSVLIKIFDSDIEKMNTSESGLITTNFHKPLVNMCQLGEVVTVGSNLQRDYKKGEIVLFSHAIMDDDYRLMGKDESCQYRVAYDNDTITEIYGKITVAKKGKQSTIIPHHNYFVSIPEPHHTFDLTRSIFQVVINYLNPKDTLARKIGIRVGDWVVCNKYSAYPIIIDRKEFWFIFFEDLLAVNKGCHKLAVMRQHVYKDFVAASRKELVELS